MRRQVIIAACILRIGLNTGSAQTHTSDCGQEHIQTKNFFRNICVKKKITDHTERPTMLLPLAIKQKSKHNDDLFSQLMYWDCRIKVKINDRFNFVLTYN